MTSENNNKKSRNPFRVLTRNARFVSSRGDDFGERVMREGKERGK